MPWLIDVVYALFLVVTAPIWLVRMLRTGKIRTDWGGRLGRGTASRLQRAGPAPLGGRRVLLHAVSVGEVNAIRLLVPRLSEAAAGDVQVVIATTTNTGFERARSLFGDRHAVVRYPLDFSWAVSGFLEAVRPEVVALIELEAWPNFCGACARRGIPVGVINGRLSARSLRRYRLVAPLLRPMFRRLSFVAAQTEAYAERFAELGVPRERLSVTGTMKWDSASLEANQEAAEALAASMGIDRQRPLVVAGSTAPGEPELIHEAVPAGVQLLCAPRRPEWFDEAASALPGCARRSTGDQGSPTGRFLLDTIGELRAAYQLADLVVVGRSFGNLHGSDMMEPVALGKPTIVGPAVSDFRDTMEALLAASAIIQCSASELPGHVRRLLDDAGEREALGARGLEVIRDRQGATDRHAELLLGLLGPNENSAASV